MKPITIWERFYLATTLHPEHWQFNHISDSHTKLSAPIAVSDTQIAAWKNATWRAHHAHLDRSNVVQGYNP
jgi:hypothetical protein